MITVRKGKETIGHWQKLPGDSRFKDFLRREHGPGKYRASWKVGNKIENKYFIVEPDMDQGQKSSFYPPQNPVIVERGGGYSGENEIMSLERLINIENLLRQLAADIVIMKENLNELLDAEPLPLAGIEEAPQQENDMQKIFGLMQQFSQFMPAQPAPAVQPQPAPVRPKSENDKPGDSDRMFK